MIGLVGGLLAGRCRAAARFSSGLSIDPRSVRASCRLSMPSTNIGFADEGQDSLLQAGSRLIATQRVAAGRRTALDQRLQLDVRPTAPACCQESPGGFRRRNGAAGGGRLLISSKPVTPCSSVRVALFQCRAFADTRAAVRLEPVHSSMVFVSRSWMRLMWCPNQIFAVSPSGGCGTMAFTSRRGESAAP